MNTTKEERLRKFGLDKYGSIKAFAAALGMAPSNLQHYLRGIRDPGFAFLKKLSLLGCDIEWLITGKTKDERLKEREKEIEEVWNRLNELGIKSKKDFENLFEDNEYMIFAKEAFERAIKLKKKQGKKDGD